MAEIFPLHAVSFAEEKSVVPDHFIIQGEFLLLIVEDIIKTMQEFAPEHLAEDNDNVGLIIGDKGKEVKTVFVTLDADEICLEEAISINADLIIAHHPLIYRPISSIVYDSYISRAIAKFIRNDISLYVAHTNLDWCDGGINDVLCSLLGLHDVSALQYSKSGAKQGRIGYINGCKLASFVETIQKQLKTRVKYSGDDQCTVKKIAVCGGAGSFLLNKVIEEKCDLYVTGELGYHDVQKAYFSGLSLIEAGHFYTENIILKIVANIIEMKYNSVDVICSGRLKCYTKFS